MIEPIVNKVSESGIVQLDLLDYKPRDIIEFDIKDRLFQGLAVKEKDLRTWLKEQDWSIYQDKMVALHCSVDAIIPPWVYMLITTYLEEVNCSVNVSSPENAVIPFWKINVSKIEKSLIHDKRVIIKGCGVEPVPNEIFAAFVSCHQKSCLKIMYGEPCSTVPIFKR